MTSQLKPCPFCGGEAKINTLPWVGGYTATALCKNEPNAHYLNTWDEDEAKAIERITDAWNTRAERTCHVVKNSRKYVLSDGTELFDDGCSICNGYIGAGENYCSNCGAKVVE